MRNRLAFPFLLALLLAHPAAAELPPAKEVLDLLGFPAGSAEKAKAGELVSTSVKSSSERELTAALAFLVKTDPAALRKELQSGLLTQIDPEVIAHGALKGPGTSADFAGAEVGADEAKAYAKGKPSSDLNLSKQEIAAFAALGGDAGAVPEQVRKQLLGRYQAYLAKGIAGVAPYARDGGKETPAGGDLRRASEAATGLAKHAPAFYAVLTGYPGSKAPGLEEAFTWSKYTAHGTPVIILTHGFSVPEGDAFLLAQRQYYVSGSYNVEQAILALLPVSEGTAAIYVNRTSTDQVAGFGGGSKRSIGSKLLASQLKGLYAKLQKKASQ